MDERDERLDWNPAMSRPGEVFTMEGRIAATGALARGLANRDPRSRRSRRAVVRLLLAVCVLAMVTPLFAVFFH
jgi:hypothetical protein